MSSVLLSVTLMRARDDVNRPFIGDVGTFRHAEHGRFARCFDGKSSYSTLMLQEEGLQRLGRMRCGEGGRRDI